ncbi:hypothetical protein DPMN_105525 [Dreissena polymorpha]|uniref:Uncharacterized protein n=1 Tax=Dreissena polymorpha TaxID=45954 RepID=A0A9D4QHS8_DREPO|nr:hypothetical protein DPMN_105525 [Dreissena polymorpha]
MDGTVLSSLEDPALKGPRGLHISQTGQLQLVCGRGLQNVVQVNGEGGVVTLASKTYELCEPESVYFSACTSRVIVRWSNQ